MFPHCTGGAFSEWSGVMFLPGHRVKELGASGQFYQLVGREESG